VKQHKLGRKWTIRLSFLAVAALLLAAFPLTTSANTLKTIHPTAVHLVDNTGSLIKNVQLSARHAGSNYVRNHSETKETGIALMILPPGRYYFTGNVSILNSRVPYFTKINSNHTMMFYYISEPVEITGNTREITLTINSADYIDVADIAGAKGFKLHVEQAELGINTVINVHSSSNGVRLFLPMRKTYNFANQQDVFPLEWPVHATPGLHFVLSAT
jgi:hypothetical protein